MLSAIHTFISAPEENDVWGNFGVLVLVPIFVGAFIVIVTVAVICLVCILPRRRKRQRASERQTSRNETVEMVHAGNDTTRQGSQVVGEPNKPPSYTCALRGKTTKPEIPNVSRLVPTAPPPTFTCAIRDPPNRPSSVGLYPPLENVST